MSDTAKKVHPPSVRLYVTDDYKLPQWFKTANPSEVSGALSIIAGLMPVLKGEVPPGLRVQQQIAEAVTKSQQAHEGALQSLMTEMKQSLSETRSMMQSRIDEVTKARDDAVTKYNSLKEDTEEDMRRMEVEIEKSKPQEWVSSEDQEKVRTHFKGLTDHTSDMFSLLAQQNTAIKDLSDNLIRLRAKEMVWYRSSKQTNQSIPWSNGEMQLAFEGAYEHAIGRPWNNMTAAKLKELESAMGKDAAKLAIEQEKGESSGGKRQRAE
jgi:hypothetical protein